MNERAKSVITPRELALWHGLDQPTPRELILWTSLGYGIPAIIIFAVGFTAGRFFS